MFDSEAPRFASRYSQFEPIGKGSYGLVFKAYDNVRDDYVAIKKISCLSCDFTYAKRILREIRFLRQLGNHENIVALRDLIYDSEEDSVYIIMDLLRNDLHQLICSQPLDIDEIRSIMFQLLKAVAYMHQGGIIHRDLKPANVLVTGNCDVCLSDFGFARYSTSEHEDEVKEDMTEHVVTRCYRPPELMLSPNKYYDLSVDMWSTGCIFAELLGRRVLFPGMNFQHQLLLIFDVLGAPLDEEVAHIRGNQARKFLRSIKGRVGTPFHELFPDAPSEALDLLQQMIVFNPDKRISANEALKHEFFKDIFEGNPPCLNLELSSASVEDMHHINEVKESILSEILDYQLENSGSVPTTTAPYRDLHITRSYSLHHMPSGFHTIDFEEISPLEDEWDCSQLNYEKKQSSAHWRCSSEHIQPSKSVNITARSPHSKMSQKLIAMLKETSYENNDYHHSRSKSSIYETFKRNESCGDQSGRRKTLFFKGMRRRTGSTVAVSISSNGLHQLVDNNGTNSPYQQNTLMKHNTHSRRPSFIKGLKNFPFPRILNRKWSGHAN